MQALFLVVVGVLAVTLSGAQMSIPSRELGFVYKNGSADAQVKVAMYIDLTCPDSQAAFPTLLKVANHYQPDQIQLKTYLFSLPYHRNSHTISKGAHVLDKYNSPNGATVYDWMQAVYDNIDSLTTSATANKTDADVLDFLGSLAFNVFGISSWDFKTWVSNRDVDLATRLEWKYGCTRGVYGTPSFTVNDVFVNADPTWTVSQWTSLIDSVLCNPVKQGI